MTEGKNNITVEKNKIVIQPLKTSPIIIRKKNMFDVFKNEHSGELSIKNIKFGSSSTLYKEDVIFDSRTSEFPWETPTKVTIVNKFNLLTNSSKTTATCTDMQGKVLIKTSDQISKVIGQKNYDTVLAALCSGHLPEKIKIQAILALLKDTGFEEKSVQTENLNFESLKMESKEESKEEKRKIKTKVQFQEEKCCQTDENCMDLLYKFKQKKKYKKNVLTPYVVTNQHIPAKTGKKITQKPETGSKRVIEDLDKKVKFETQDCLPEPDTILPERDPHLPELYLDDASNNSDLMSNVSISCDTVALRQAENEMLTSIGQRTMNFQPSKIVLPDGSSIMVPVKPEDDFHIATPVILNNVLPEEKTKLLWYQAYIDWRRCLDRDGDGFLPLHNAVLNRDADLVKRQCVVLKTRHQSLDIPADKMTALQISIVQDSLECTVALLRHGADVLNPDEEHRAAAHLAAEGASDQLQAVLNHCQDHARDVLLYHEEELWKPEYETKTDEELAAILVRHVCNMADSQGYTPLMIAAKMGNYTNVKLLVEACPSSVNAAMPNSGNTALFLATGEACLDAARRGNKSKVADHYHRTITILVENGADPTVTNYAGTSVNDLLTESNNTELSMLFANVMTAVNFFDGAPPPANFNKFMLVKNGNGDVKLTDIKKETSNLTDLNAKTKKETVKRSRKSKGDGGKARAKETDKDKPMILANVALSATKKVIVHPQTILKGDIKLINPKEKLIKTINTSDEQKIDSPANFVTLVSNRTIIINPFIKSEKADDKMTETQTVASTSTVAAEATSQAFKRKIATYGPSRKKNKCEKADDAGGQG